MSESSNALSGFAGIDAMSVGDLAILPAATLASLKAQVEQIYEEAHRLDDKLDLTEAIGEGIPSIAMMNQQTQPAQGENDPNQQGAQGANNAEKPQGEAGSDAPMGSNRGPGGVVQYRADGTRVAA
jgi:hypothetical protein